MSRFLVDRGIFENSIWQDPAAFRLFIYLIGKAAFKDHKTGEVEIKRGQYLRSYRRVQEDLLYFENHSEKRYSLCTIKRCIETLKRDGRITAEETKLGTLYTVVNYESYQVFPGQQEKEHRTLTEQRQNTDRTIRTKQTKQVNNPPVSPQGGKTKKAFRLPEDWEPTPELLAWAKAKHPTVNTETQTELFKNHFLANGKTMVDWSRAWQNWIARSPQFGRPNPITSHAVPKKTPLDRLKEALSKGFSLKCSANGLVYKPQELQLIEDPVFPRVLVTSLGKDYPPSAFEVERQ